jgi:hypothetical protein
MPGLLDMLGSNDPQSEAMRQGLLQMGLALMQAKGNVGEILGQAGQRGVAGMQGFQDRQFQEKLRAQAMADIARKRVLEGRVDEDYTNKKLLESLPAQFAQTGQQMGNSATIGQTGNLAPTRDNAQIQSANAQPGFDYQGLIGKYQSVPGGMDRAMALQNAIKKDTTPIAVPQGASLVDPHTRKAFFTNPAKPEATPNAIEEYRLAVSQGYPGTFTQWDLERRKSGAASTTVKIDNALGGGIAKEVGPLIATSFQQATSAQQTIKNADSLMKVLDSGKVIAGPTASFRVAGLQIGQILGVGGKDAQELLANTRSVIQDLAKSALAARGQLKGQGQVSDYEGRLLKEAESGNIDNLTVNEIKVIAKKNKELSQQLIGQHQSFISKVKNHKDPAISGLSDFFDINPDPGKVRDYNPVTGKLE